ncbi:unnamed protein product, partial [marine sediment metagenome]
PLPRQPLYHVEWLDRKASNDDKFKGYSYKVFGQQDKEALDFDPKDLVVECQANWDGLEKPLVGLGVVTKIERESKTGGEVDELTAKGYRAPVIRLHPQTMLFKRARAAALKQHYHIPAPILEELPYTTIIETEYHVVTEEPSKGDDTNDPELIHTLHAEVAEGEGFSIDLTWLNESQKALKWTDDTMLTFVISQYKVSDTSVTGALNKLTREQAEDFVSQINKRVEKQQPGLFE